MNCDLEIPVLYHTESTSLLSELDIEVKLESCEVRALQFLEISAVGSYKEDGAEYGCIYSNGEHFFSPLKKTDILKLLKS